MAWDPLYDEAMLAGRAANEPANAAAESILQRLALGGQDLGGQEATPAAPQGGTLRLLAQAPTGVAYDPLYGVDEEGVPFNRPGTAPRPVLSQATPQAALAATGARAKNIDPAAGGGLGGGLGGLMRGARDQELAATSAAEVDAAAALVTPPGPLDVYKALLADKLAKAPLGMTESGSTGSSSKSTTFGIKPRPGSEKERTEQAGRLKDAEDAAARAESQSAQQQARLNQIYADKIALDEEERKGMLAARAARYAAFDREMSAKRRQVASMRVDPNHWANSASMIQKMHLVQGAALAGWVAGFRGGGGNAGLDAIDKLIDRDIAAQKANIEKAHGDYSNIRGALADFMRAGESMDAAAAQTKIGWLEQLKARTTAVQLATRSPVIMANAEAHKAAIDAKLSALNDDAFEKAQDRVSKTSGGSTTKVPLVQLWAQAQLATQVAKAKGGAASAKDKMDAGLVGKLEKIQVARARLRQLEAMQSTYGVGKAAAGWGTVMPSYLTGSQTETLGKATKETLATVGEALELKELGLEKGWGYRGPTPDRIAALKKALNDQSDIIFSRAQAAGQDIVPYGEVEMKSRTGLKGAPLKMTTE